MFDPDRGFVALDRGHDRRQRGLLPGLRQVYRNRAIFGHVLVRRAWHNRRIASALIRTAFRALCDLGGRTIELHVDSDNTTYVLELYRSLGMRPVWHPGLYEKTYEE